MAGTPEQHIYILRNQLGDQGKALEEETRQKTELKTANEQLTAEVRRQKEAYTKLEKHTKNCEKATGKAQKDVKNAKGHADHLINSQKGQLRNAERRYEEASRELKEWRDKYGWSVEKPSEDKYALQVRLSEWQSKAEKAHNQIALLEAQVQGTPEQIGLHQALEQWEEHQGCSEEFASLQDKVHDLSMLKQKLETDLTNSKERHQKTKADMKILQNKADQLERNKKDFEILRIKSDKLDEANTALQERLTKMQENDRELPEEDKIDEYMARKEQLEIDFKALEEQYRNTEFYMKALQEKVVQLGQANKAFRDKEKSYNDMLQKLESDLKASKEQFQETESNMKALREKADQLESDLKTTKEQYQTTESNMKALQGKAGQLESDLKSAKGEHQTTKSDMETLQGKADQLKSDLKAAKEQLQTTKSDKESIQGKADQLESELKTTKEKLETTKSNMETLQEKADQLEVANKTLEENSSKKPEQDIKTQQAQTETPKGAERSQVTLPSSPIYTTDEDSQDFEKTPRPKKSLHQDLGYSSPDQNDEQQSDNCMPQQEGAMTSKQAKTGEEKKRRSAENWETDDSEDAELNTRWRRQEMKKRLSVERPAKNLETLEIRTKERAKEQSEALETLFECTPAKANAIDRRLKALGPGCRLQEAPALVAYELSGIPENIYKDLASGQLIATMPPNEVKDVGTSPDRFADDMATDTTDLPAEKVVGPLFVAKDMATGTTDLAVENVVGPLFVAKDMATDTTDLAVEKVSAPHTRSSRLAAFFYLLMSLMIFFGLFCLYMELKSDRKPKTQHGILYKNIYSHRHTPFPTPARYASTPITFVYPPTPAPQLGLERMMMGSSLGGVMRGRGR